MRFPVLLAEIAQLYRKRAFLRIEILCITLKGEHSAFEDVGRETQRKIIQMH
jgi:hypothetical protein